MKRLLIAVVTLVLSATTINAQRLANVNLEAKYITEKMVVELGLSNAQRSSVLNLNLNYLNGITSYRDIDSQIWKSRNKKLKSILTPSQWKLYKNAYYFYRPIGWKDGAYVHNIFAKYPQGQPKQNVKKYGKRNKQSRNNPWHQNNIQEKKRENTFGSRR